MISLKNATIFNITMWSLYICVDIYKARISSRTRNGRTKNPEPNLFVMSRGARCAAGDLSAYLRIYKYIFENPFNFRIYILLTLNLYFFSVRFSIGACVRKSALVTLINGKLSTRTWSHSRPITGRDVSARRRLINSSLSANSVPSLIIDRLLGEEIMFWRSGFIDRRLVFAAGSKGVSNNGTETLTATTDLNCKRRYGLRKAKTMSFWRLSKCSFLSVLSLRWRSSYIFF